MPVPESGQSENVAASSVIESDPSSDTLSADLKALANQGVFLDLGGPSASMDNAEESDQATVVGSPRPVTRGSTSGPPSPPSSGTVSRKRSAAAAAAAAAASAAASVSSSAAASGKSLRGVTAKNATTRSASAAKRPKVAHNN